jgi:cytochrome c556
MCQHAAEGRLDHLKILCENRADVAQGNYDGRTPLHLAACNASTATMEYLLKQDAVRVNSLDRFGATPLDDAIRHCKKTAQSMLEEAGGMTGEQVRGLKQSLSRVKNKLKIITKLGSLSRKETDNDGEKVHADSAALDEQASDAFSKASSSKSASRRMEAHSEAQAPVIEHQNRAQLDAPAISKGDAACASDKGKSEEEREMERPGTTARRKPAKKAPQGLTGSPTRESAATGNQARSGGEPGSPIKSPTEEVVNHAHFAAELLLIMFRSTNTFIQMLSNDEKKMLINGCDAQGVPFCKFASLQIGDVIVRQGDEGNSMFMIVEGEVKVLVSFSVEGPKQVRVCLPFLRSHLMGS